MAVGIVSAAGTGDLAISTSAPSRLMGYSCSETAAAVATAVIRDGSSTSGTPVAYINLAASAGTTIWFGPNGILCPSGIFLDRVTGTTQFVVYIA